MINSRAVRIKAALHELRCSECRVTWYSWLLRLLRLGGMSPAAATDYGAQPEYICPHCRIERADYEHDDGGYLPTCPNCGTAAAPTPTDAQ